MAQSALAMYAAHGGSGLAGEVVRHLFGSPAALAWAAAAWGGTMAIVLFCLAMRSARFDLRAAVAKLCSRRLLLHPSALLDYRFYLAMSVINRLIAPLWLAPEAFLIFGLAKLTEHALHAATGFAGFAPGAAWMVLAIGMTLFLARDFASYVGHRVQHMHPLLWEAHKVHHAAERLVPATGRRMHPFEHVVTGLVGGVLLGPLYGVLALATNLGVVELIAIGLVADEIGRAATLGYVRHSHLPLRFPGVLERIAVSPLYHQIHHSVDPAHHNRNYGRMLSLWDGLLGTHHPTAGVGRLAFGLGAAEGGGYQSLRHIYLTPPARAWRLLLDRGPAWAAWRTPRGRRLAPARAD